MSQLSMTSASAILLGLFTFSVLAEPVTFATWAACPRSHDERAAPCRIGAGLFTAAIEVDGTGEITTQDGKVIPIRIDTDKGSVDNLDFLVFGDDLILVFNREYGGEGAASVVRLSAPDYRERWNTPLPGFNPGTAALEGQYLYVSALGFVGALDVETGEFHWKHEIPYQEFRFNSFETPVVGPDSVTFYEQAYFRGEVVVPRRIVARKADGTLLEEIAPWPFGDVLRRECEALQAAGNGGRCP